MTEKDYRNIQGIRRSELWKLNPANGGTPQKFLWALNNPTEPTPAMLLGALAHKALLEPQTFDEEYIITPVVDKRTKDGKAAWTAFLEAAGERTAVPHDLWSLACEMATQVQETPYAVALLSGQHEYPIVWVDPDTQEPCKVRLDCLSGVLGVPVIVEYKTTKNACNVEFEKRAINMGYHLEAGMQCEAILQTTGLMPRYVFIIQETDAPYAVNMLEADGDFIQLGRDLFRELLGIYHECKVTGNWYGYLGPDAKIDPLSPPVWALNK